MTQPPLAYAAGTPLALAFHFPELPKSLFVATDMPKESRIDRKPSTPALHAATQLVGTEKSQSRAGQYKQSSAVRGSTGSAARVVQHSRGHGHR
jgi:hypothetical protein